MGLEAFPRARKYLGALSFRPGRSPCFLSEDVSAWGQGTEASPQELADIQRVSLTQLCLLLLSRIREIF